MTRWRLTAFAASVLACAELTGDLGRVVAIELVGSATPRVEEGDTLRLQARARRANGEVVPDAKILWVVLDVDSGQIGFTLDSVTGLITAMTPSTGRVQARVEQLATQPIVVTVTPAADSLAIVDATRIVFDTVAADSSPPLQTLVLDLTTSPGSPAPLAAQPVQYVLVEPAPGSGGAQGVFLTPSGETEPGSDPHAATAVTGAQGQASVVLRRLAGVALPDSVLVDASAVTAIGALVPGSPIQFTVLLQ